MLSFGRLKNNALNVEKTIQLVLCFTTEIHLKRKIVFLGSLKAAH